MLLREILSEVFEGYFLKNGDFCVLNVKAFFEKTNYLLSSNSTKLSDKKARPIIISEVKNETVKFLTTTTNLFTRQYRPKISIENCKIFKKEDECFGLNLKRKHSWIFAKKTSKAKRFRVFYTIDIHTLKDLEEKGLFKICGNCKDALEEIIKKAYELGEIL